MRFQNNVPASHFVARALFDLGNARGEYQFNGRRARCEAEFALPAPAVLQVISHLDRVITKVCKTRQA